MILPDSQVSATIDLLILSTVRENYLQHVCCFILSHFSLHGILRFPSHSAEIPLFYFPFRIPFNFMITLEIKSRQVLKRAVVFLSFLPFNKHLPNTCHVPDTRSTRRKRVPCLPSSRAHCLVRETAQAEIQSHDT